MKAKLIDGSVVELIKDCDCITHIGPHWLHMNNLWHERNQKLLDTGNLYGFMHEEVLRLEQKAYDMESKEISEIIPQ